MSDFFDHPLSKPYRVDVFERFVREFETRMNRLSLVQMGAKVSSSWQPFTGSGRNARGKNTEF